MYVDTLELVTTITIELFKITKLIVFIKFCIEDQNSTISSEANVLSKYKAASQNLYRFLSYGGTNKPDKRQAKILIRPLLILKRFETCKNPQITADKETTDVTDLFIHFGTVGKRLIRI